MMMYTAARGCCCSPPVVLRLKTSSKVILTSLLVPVSSFLSSHSCAGRKTIAPALSDRKGWLFVHHTIHHGDRKDSRAASMRRSPPRKKSARYQKIDVISHIQKIITYVHKSYRCYCTTNEGRTAETNLETKYSTAAVTHPDCRHGCEGRTTKCPPPRC